MTINAKIMPRIIIAFPASFDTYLSLELLSFFKLTTPKITKITEAQSQSNSSLGTE